MYDDTTCDEIGHEWGPVTESRMGGAFVQYCQRSGCRFVCGLADDDYDDDANGEDQ